MQLKIYILSDNHAGGKFQAEHGLSYLVEINQEKILFDTGHSDLFLTNAKLFGIDLHNEVNTVVLSHGHWDHGNGLKYIQHKKLITHPASFTQRFGKKTKAPVGLNSSKKEIQDKFELVETRKPMLISENLYFLGEIPRLNSFETTEAFSVNENGKDDFIPDDSALAALVNNEIVVITGCSHSGICNICEHAKKVLETDKIKAVIGGFHLINNQTQTIKTIEYFRKNGIKEIFPSHCTDLAALSALHNEFQFEQVKTGMILDF